jgi:hypothetical protein
MDFTPNGLLPILYARHFIFTWGPRMLWLHGQHQLQLAHLERSLPVAAAATAAAAAAAAACSHAAQQSKHPALVMQYTL